MRRDTETTCHCGAQYNGSDHCSECGCEQYESINVRDCGHIHGAIQMAHLHVATIPANFTVQHAGMVRVNFTDDTAAGNACDDQGKTTVTFRRQPTALSVALYQRDAARLAGDILKGLTAAERSSVLTQFIR